MNSKPLIPVSIGELFDKVSILEIKLLKIKNKDKLANVRNEWEMLKKITEQYDTSLIKTTYKDLVAVNKSLWEIEDKLRKQEKHKQFNDRFIELARGVYYSNDRRSDLKREINKVLGSTIVEEKDYEEYRK